MDGVNSTADAIHSVSQTSAFTFTENTTLTYCKYWQGDDTVCYMATYTCYGISSRDYHPRKFSPTTSADAHSQEFDLGGG